MEPIEEIRTIRKKSYIPYSPSIETMSERITSEITTSERTFFSLRYTISGYTFILIIILVTLPKLLVLVSGLELAGPISVFLGFLLSGPPAGFLISQIWYVLFKSDHLWRIGFWRYLGLNAGMIVQDRRRRYLRNEYGLRVHYHQELTFSNYLHTLLEKEEDPWRTYTERRFNLMHILGSSFFAILLGSIVSLIPMLSLFLTNGTTLVVVVYEIWLLVFIVIISVYLLSSLRNVHLEHALASEVSISKAVNDNLLSIEEARIIFHSNYFIRE